MKQQTPVQGKNSIQVVIDLNLGSQFAKKLGLGDIKEWDATTATTASDSSVDLSSGGIETSNPSTGSDGNDASSAEKAKKKSKKKKKK
jgi:hypothetical protein